MQRVVVIGSSGSGKTTVARRIAAELNLPLLELDAVFHRTGWNQEPDDRFHATVAGLVETGRWVVDGSYTSHGMPDVLWPKADTFVWLDLSKGVAMRRVIARTLRRVLTREKLWNEVTEPWTNLYSLDPEKNIMVWAWTHHSATREKYDRLAYQGAFGDADVHRLRTPGEVDAFLSGLAGSTASKHH